MPLTTRADAKAMSDRLHRARVDPAYQCPTEYLDPTTGMNYRLEPKPRGRKEILEKYGHVCDVVFSKEPQDDPTAPTPGVLHVRVPLGTHGGDHLAVDLETDAVVCVLCHKGTG